MTKKYDKEWANRLKSELAGLPAPEGRGGMSKQEVVKFIHRELVELQKRGYTIPEIAQILTERGMGIAGNTLKNYMNAARKKTNKDTPAKKKDDRTTTATTAATHGTATEKAAAIAAATRETRPEVARMGMFIVRENTTEI
ncbi:MAG: hypothetical protein K6346_03890 [Halothiobacillaceae bacterium]